jgi:rRNA-processing protein FCF1
MLRHKHKTLFLDTNIYLHYQSFDQVDWRKLLEARRITLSVPNVVLNELDKHKDEHRVRRIRKRAAAVSARLFEYFDTNKEEVRPGVILEFLPFDPQVNFAIYHLNPSRQDDRLLAAVLKLREEKKDLSPVIVANDYNLLMKAKQLGIEIYRLPEDLKLPEEPDAEEQHLKELERELNRMRKAVAPDLRMCFGPEGADHVTFMLPSPKLMSELLLGFELASLRLRYPKAPPPEQVISFAERGKLKEAAGELKNAERAAEMLVTFGEMMGQIHPSEVERYNFELENYFRAYEQYRKDVIEYENMWSRTLRLEVELVNEGTCPAEDVDVTLEFPEGVTLLTEGSFPPVPVEPHPPSPPQTLGMQTGALIAKGVRKSVSLLKPKSAPAPQLTSGHLSPQATTTPSVTPSANNRRVEFKVPKLKHTLRARCVTLYAFLNSFEAAGSFTILYRAVAANIPQPVTGCLHVKIEKSQPSVIFTFRRPISPKK